MCCEGSNIEAEACRHEAVVIEQLRRSCRDEEGDPRELLTCWLVVGGDGGGNDYKKAEVKGFIKLIKLILF